MPNIDMPMDYDVWDAMLEHYQTHAKTGQYSELKDHFVDDTE